MSGNEQKMPAFGLAEDIFGPDFKLPEQPAATPAPTTMAASRAGQKHVTFFLENEEYALPIAQVREIDRAGEITRVPHLPPHVRGVVNLRGRIIPVIDLRTRLGLAAGEIGRASRVVVCEVGPRTVGMLVDRVAQVLDIQPEQVEEAPEELSPTGKNFVRGVARIDDRLVIMLELDPVAQR